VVWYDVFEEVYLQAARFAGEAGNWRRRLGTSLALGSTSDIVTASLVHSPAHTYQLRRARIRSDIASFAAKEISGKIHDKRCRDVIL